MVYKENLVCVVKNNGNILRENKGIVSLPFASEYSLLIKNLNSRKASVKISIDGKDVLGDKSLIINSNSESELEGFLDGFAAKNKFKFIQKTKQIQDHRGDFIDDGMIRVEFAFEKPVHIHSYTYLDSYPAFNGSSGGTLLRSSVQSINCCSSSQTMGSSVCEDQIADEGITVKGSEINQNFNHGYIGALEDSQVIIIRLRGEKNNGGFVSKPITVKSKLRCSSCGKYSKSSSQFCSACGTFLE